MKNILLILVILAIAGAGYYLHTNPEAKQSALGKVNELIDSGKELVEGKGKQDAAPAAEAPPPTVTVLTIQPRDVSITEELNGRVVPYLIAEVRPQVQGIIQDRLFEEGADVEKDAQLYQIDPATYEAQLARAEAGLAKAYANADVADVKMARYEQLVEANAVNRQEYDEVKAQAKQADAEVTIAETEVRIAKINVDYAKVLAPISGRIGKSNVTVGALVTASQPSPLATVQQLDPIYVDVTQPISWMLNQADSLQAGILQNTGESYGSMTVDIDAGKPYPEKGKLLFADVTVDQTTGTINLRAEFPNPNHVLLPGMFVKAHLEVDRQENAVTVPQRALMRQHDGTPYVLVAKQDGTVEQRPVKTVRTTGDDWLISGGLTAGERVVIEGTQRIRFLPGAPAPKVNAVEAAAAKKQ